MSSESKVKGTKYESAVVGFFNEKGYSARREVLHGTEDEGDVKVTVGGLEMVVECKNRKSMSPKWLMDLVDEVNTETENANASFGVAVVHRDGCGDKSTGRSIVVMDAEMLSEFMKGWNL